MYPLFSNKDGGGEFYPHFLLPDDTIQRNRVKGEIKTILLVSLKIDIRGVSSIRGIQR